ncbi:hypothetical protein [Eikenella longinqua]|nr:hypothetical protein [Eikenella longinqua]
MVKRSILGWMKLVCLCGMMILLWRGNAAYALLPLLAYAAAEIQQRRNERAALAAFRANPEAARQWFAEHLSGERIADIKAVRARFSLSLRDAVAVLGEHVQQEKD